MKLKIIFVIYFYVAAIYYPWGDDLFVQKECKKLTFSFSCMLGFFHSSDVYTLFMNLLLVINMNTASYQN